MPHNDDEPTKNRAASPAGAATQLRLAASVLGASGVALGAFGAHGLHDRLTARGKLEQWKTAVLYQLVHTVAVFSVSVLCDATSISSPNAAAVPQPNKNNSRDAPKRYPMAGKAGQCMALGSLLFSGSIYLLCLDLGPKKVLGPTTPIGGLLMIAGWAMLSCTAKE